MIPVSLSTEPMTKEMYNVKFKNILHILQSTAYMLGQLDLLSSHVLHNSNSTFENYTNSQLT